MPKFDVFGPLPFNRELTRTYDLIEAPTPLHALWRVHYDALGKGRVKIRDERIVFTHADDLALACGWWKITRCGWNGHSAISEILVLPHDRLDIAA
jgi:hypothetical protein